MRTNYGLETLEVEHGALKEKIGIKDDLYRHCDPVEAAGIQHDIRQLEQYADEVSQCIKILKLKVKEGDDVERKPRAGAKMAKCGNQTYSYCYHKCAQRKTCDMIGKPGRSRKE